MIEWVDVFGLFPEVESCDDLKDVYEYTLQVSNVATVFLPGDAFLTRGW